MRPVAVVTGASSGIGKATAAALRDRGCVVYDLSRRDVPVEGVIHIPTDITSEESVKNAIETISEREGRIDLLINNAGCGISGAIEFTDPSDLERQFNVNLFGGVRVTQAVLPVMRRAGQGRILFISSVAAIAPIPYQAFYSASKAAVMVTSMALANEVRPFGISVTAVLPGDIRTGFTDARAKSEAGDDVYGGRIVRSVGKMEQDERHGMAPEKAGRRIAAIALSRSRKPVKTLGVSYKLIYLLVKFLPISLVNRLISVLYVK